MVPVYKYSVSFVLIVQQKELFVSRLKARE